LSSYTALRHPVITVCTAYRERFFGEISDGGMRLSETGKTVQAEWLKTPVLRPDCPQSENLFGRFKSRPERTL
jgi:hypothetical protein